MVRQFPLEIIYASMRRGLISPLMNSSRCQSNISLDQIMQSLTNNKVRDKIKPFPIEQRYLYLKSKLNQALQQNLKENKQATLTMIFSQNTILPTFGYYPYMLSLGNNVNCYNYFPLGYSAFLSNSSNHIVQHHQNKAPLIISHKVNHQHSHEQVDFSKREYKKEILKEQQRSDAQIIQLCNRNVLPNNVSLILCFIRRIKKSGKEVQKIIEKLAQDQKFTTKRFYAYQLFLKENHNDFKWKQGVEALVNYLDPSCPSFSIKEQQFYNRVCRILISTYLEKICRLQVLNHSKINRNYVQDHLKVMRYIRQTLKGKYKPKMLIKYK